MIRGKRAKPKPRLPETKDFVKLAVGWQPDALKLLWNYVWQGWDSYCLEVLSKVDLSEVDDQLERMITQNLELDIRSVMSGYEPFVIQHERYEAEQRSPAPARPKQPDLSFVWTEEREVTYPLEAKVLRSDSSSGVRAYVEDITENFLRCRYAPFSSEAGMLGYLLEGISTIAFNNIATAVPCTLSDHPDFLGREHKVSDHKRSVPTGKNYPAQFRCHHLLLELSKKAKAKKATTKKNISNKTP
ncbi:MAG: hypothetical protein WA919_26270 [Coleofasciculaceae cyanobacterium]